MGTCKPCALQARSDGFFFIYVCDNFSSQSCTEPLGANTPSVVRIHAIPLFENLKRLSIMDILFSSVVIVLLLVVFAAVTQAAVECLMDCDNDKEGGATHGKTERMP